MPSVVSPVTLRPRFNAVASGDSPIAEAALPYDVDARQMSLFGAVWTLGSIKHLAEANVQSLTYYETTGCRGVIEQQVEIELNPLFLSEPGMIFPLYYVFAAIANRRSAVVLECLSSNNLAVQALALQNNRGILLLAANLTSEQQAVEIGQIPGETLRIRRLNDETAELATFNPRQFLSDGSQQIIQNGSNIITYTLMPYELLTMETG
jgi:hypothetical protein